jgi:hypothetical protein
MNTIDFLASLKPGDNRLYEILRIERADKGLKIVVGCSDGLSTSKCLEFGEVSNFGITLFGAPGDSEELPQTLIGLDYWRGVDSSAEYNWELNGDECTWNFIAPLPKVASG